LCSGTAARSVGARLALAQNGAQRAAPLLVVALSWPPLALGQTLGLRLRGKEALAQRGHLAQGAGRDLSRLFVAAKKLFAHKEHSDAVAVAGDVLVMPLAGADLLAILHGIAAEGHSGAEQVTVFHQVLGQPPLYLLDDLRLREEAVGPPLNVALGHTLGPLQGLFEADLLVQRAVPLSFHIRV